MKYKEYPWTISAEASAGSLWACTSWRHTVDLGESLWSHWYWPSRLTRSTNQDILEPCLQPKGCSCWQARESECHYTGMNPHLWEASRNWKCLNLGQLRVQVTLGRNNICCPVQAFSYGLASSSSNSVGILACQLWICLTVGSGSSYFLYPLLSLIGAEIIPYTP